MPTTLIEPAELAAVLGRPFPAGPFPAGPLQAGLHGAGPRWAIVDCRFDLTRPAWGEAAYAQGHIPGAVYANLDRDLSGPVEARSGRHPLPPLEKLAATLGALGIDRQTAVVAYDQGNGAYAARLWWLLRWAGHREAAVLNGGFAAWQRAGLPVSTEPAKPAARRFTIEPATGVVTTPELARWVSEGALAGGEAVLIDARGADRFAGQNETLDPVAGHVPGARNHPFTGNLDADGRFLPAAELRRRWLQTLGGTPAERVISMCGSGVTACHNLLAMEVAGLSGARLYAGSWSEWIRDPDRPVARGST